jgi:hypothetical protein
VGLIINKSRSQSAIPDVAPDQSALPEFAATGLARPGMRLTRHGPPEVVFCKYLFLLNILSRLLLTWVNAYARAATDSWLQLGFHKETSPRPS